MTRAMALTTFILFFVLIGITGSRADVPRKAPLDKQGRFWVYRNIDSGMFFLPYAVMPEEGSSIISMSTDCEEKPHEEIKPAVKETTKPPADAPSEKNTCIKVKLTWAAPGWCGCAFVSGPDKPAWWGEDDRGTHYDLSGLTKKRLVFWARGETGKERIQVKMGILGDKQFGDSIKIAPETRWLKLTSAWTRYELDLSKITPDALRAICNGFTFVCSRIQQDDPYTRSTTFYLDDIYYE